MHPPRENVVGTSRNIRFVSRHGIQEVVVPKAGQIIFRTGETKEVHKDVAAVLLMNADFIDAELGYNPNFCCTDCGVESLSESFVSPRCEVVRYSDELGQRLCVSDFLRRNPEWHDWHDILERRTTQVPIAPPKSKDLLFRIAPQPANLKPSFSSRRAIYSIGDNFAEGECAIGCDDELRLHATFETELERHLPLKRRFAPGRFVRDYDTATIEATDKSWRVEEAVAESQGESYLFGRDGTGRLIARIGELIVPTPGPPSTASHLRWIVRGCKSLGGWYWRDAFIYVNEITADSEIDACSVLILGKASLTDHEDEALWNTLCLLEGRNVQRVLTESYDSAGTLLQQRYRIGNRSTAETFSPFNYCGVDVTSNQIASIQEALIGMHEAGFNIDKVLDYLLFSCGGHMTHEALHLSVAAHTIAHEWLQYWKMKSRSGDRAAQSNRAQQRARGHIMTKDSFAKALPALRLAVENALSGAEVHDRVKATILRSVDKANEATMGERLLRVLEDDLKMELDADDRRALGYRNELAHEGGFSVDFFDLNSDEKDLRLGDVGRLRNIVTEAVLRLCGYSGTVDDFTLPGAVRFIKATPPSPFLGGSRL